MRARGAGLSVVATIVASLLMPVASHASTPTPGTRCAKFGAVVTTGTKRFVCVRAGKKQIWRLTALTPSPTPVPSPVKYVPPIPISLPVPARSITFANILTKMNEVVQAAFDDVHLLIAKNELPQEIKATIWVGPNTTLIGGTNSKARFDDIMRVWAGFAQPKIFGAFLFSTVDEPAAEIAFANWVRENRLTTTPSASVLANECHKQLSVGQYATGPLEDCVNANAGVIDIAGTGMALMGVPTQPGPRSDPYRAGALENHEYVHMVQAAQFVDNVSQPGQRMQQVSPCWLAEGMAHFVGKSSASATVPDYLKQRNGEAKQRLNQAGETPPRDAEKIAEYLSLQTLPGCIPNYDWGYATGMLAVEALAAIGGVQSTMALYTQEARGHSFTEAFKLVYGISWDEARPVLAQVIAKDYLLASMGS